MKLDDALQEREASRLEVFAAREHLNRMNEKQRDAERHLAAVRREVDEALLRHTAARRRFVRAVDKLKPLLDADVAGIVGKLPNETTEPEALPAEAAL